MKQQEVLGLIASVSQHLIATWEMRRRAVFEFTDYYLNVRRMDNRQQALRDFCKNKPYSVRTLQRWLNVFYRDGHAGLVPKVASRLAVETQAEEGQ